MLTLYSNPKWLLIVRGAVERLTETPVFSAVQCTSITRKGSKKPLRPVKNPAQTSNAR